MPDDEKNETTEELTEPTPEEPAPEAPAEDEGPSEEPTAEVVTDRRAATAAITRKKCLRIADPPVDSGNTVSKL